ncbi:MAG: membrane-associated protein [Parcubacteria group bacterium Gr01-1014_48]|nr:MAG: membrane-associated protein [Parcubacteria group bacterium Greene0416_14]TSC74365.1 MAG: membrane-associated protein [Parcubacteria group bacterium Gr01-1014_48]TSD00718.1 MAG: membrane-associated protein [Parcubacteria group bacterium Greene1014_15]TSD07687.1 MAG: membrane-associated protein [Parcubacteria group bacterium Greene0714_4]
MEFFGIDLVSLIKTIGYLGVFGMVFAESGLLIGFMFPGDSLLFTAGFLASQGIFNIVVLICLCFVAAVLGDSFGYAFGKRIGPALFTKENSLLFNKKNIERSRVFYERYGGKAIILARFMPFVRTFAPILAGVGAMNYKRFVFFNVIGAFAWAVGITALGYFLGSIIPSVDTYLFPIVILVIFLSLLPGIIHFIKDGTFRALLRRLKKQKG